MADDPSAGQNRADHLPVYTDDHLRVVARLAELGGAARYADLAAVVSQRAIAAACRDGVLVHLGRDRYVDPGVSDHLKAAIGLGGVLSHLSAAAQHGWSLKSMPARPHVTVRPNRHLPRGRLTAARVFYRTIGEEQVIDSVTEPVRTVLDCARDLPFDEALTVADSALRSGSVSRADLREARTAVRGRRSRTARSVLGAADARSANPLESVLRAICLEVPGLQVEPQVEFDLSHRAMVDLADRHLGIVIEAEGFETHGTRNGFDKDCRRYTEMVCAGQIVLRFTYTQVMRDPDWVRARVSEAISISRARTG
ncbi:hypothetical protein [Allobranchiibius huperziae]|uniref:Very-short-patch-repair endonuclease n=1 Tax=Allobranchiibius huperziae TaxID=1874116 RepID=A0A853DM94_9MICO|nr:hypothetical protein [Allobranchiibius huperziae]NYJ75245.1 very-short-patch-repair endonuclease [Allobranchiibius huperziae]